MYIPISFWRVRYTHDVKYLRSLRVVRYWASQPPKATEVDIQFRCSYNRRGNSTRKPTHSHLSISPLQPDQNKDLLFKSSPIHHQHGSPLPISVPHNHTQISLNSNTNSVAIPTHKLNAKLCSSLELLSSAIQSHQTPITGAAHNSSSNHDHRRRHLLIWTS
jgi:hypothetical protein